MSRYRSADVPAHAAEATVFTRKCKICFVYDKNFERDVRSRVQSKLRPRPGLFRKATRRTRVVNELLSWFSVVRFEINETDF